MKRSGSRNRRSGATGRFSILLLVALFAQQASGQVVVQSSSFEGQWLNPDDALSIQLDHLPDPGEGDVHVIIGATDVTSLLLVGSNNLLRLDSRVFSLPRGESEVVLYLVNGTGEWREISRQLLQVHMPGGFESSEFNPQLNLTNKGQLDENTFGDAVKSDRQRFQDIAAQIGFTSRHTRGDLELRSSLNLLGTSVREEALRFGEKGQNAPKLDLSDYLIEVDKGNARLAVGHISYGNNSLLISNVANRGIIARYALGGRMDISVSSMNGTSIVGYSNILGQNSRDHNISAASLGFEFLPSRPGGLRMEITYMDASIQSLFNFDVGEVPDAETNRGMGLRLTGSNHSGRLRGDLTLARSRYRNPNDPFLAQGDNLVKVKATTDMARHLELGYDIIQSMLLGETLDTSITFSYTYDRTDPLYKSVAAFTRADWKANQFALSGQLGQLGMQLQYLDGEDNIDKVPTILKTKTRSSSASFSAPLPFLLGNMQTTSPWWPNLVYTYNRTRQFAANDPDFANSGFNGGSHLPDQVTTSHDVEAQWLVDRWSLGYRFSLNDQDNRQAGRETADFKVVTRTLNIGVQATESINISGDFSLGRNDDRAQDLERETRSWGVNADWRISPRWAVNGSYTLTRQDDSQDQAKSNSQSANAQLNWNFSLPAAGRKMPGQAFIRYALEDSRSSDQLFGFETNQRIWTVNSGLSLSLF